LKTYNGIALDNMQHYIKQEYIMNRHTIRLGYYSAWGILLLMLIHQVAFFLPEIYDPHPVWHDSITSYDYRIVPRTYTEGFCELIYFLQVPFILILFACFHDYASSPLKILSRISFSIIIIFSVLNTISYLMRLTIVDLVYDEYMNEHMNYFTYAFLTEFCSRVEIFSWTILLGLAMLFLIPVFSKTRIIGKTLQLTLLITGINCLLCALLFILQLDKIFIFCFLLDKLLLVILMVLSIKLFRWFIMNKKEGITISDP
jgi:hypothetical protein